MVISIPAVKLVAQVAASVGVSKVIGDVVRSTAIVNTTADSVKVFIGSLVISSMVVDYTSNYISNTVDNVVEGLEKMKQEKSDQNYAS